MSENETISFAVGGDFGKSVFRRYRFILSRGFGLRFLLLTLLILVLLFLWDEMPFKYLIILVLLVVWLVMLIGNLSLSSLLTLLDIIFS